MDDEEFASVMASFRLKGYITTTTTTTTTMMTTTTTTLIVDEDVEEAGLEARVAALTPLALGLMLCLHSLEVSLLFLVRISRRYT